MPAKIHMNDQSTFDVAEDFEDVERAYKEAIATGGTFRIVNSSGKVHVLNTAYVSRIENLMPEDERQAAEVPAAQAQ